LKWYYKYPFVAPKPQTWHYSLCYNSELS
jgi:hypothetical protein